MPEEVRVEEVETEDEDSDTQGVGLVAPSRRPTRVVSDSLRFTGVDLGDRSNSYPRGSYRYGDSEEDLSASATEDEDEDADSGDSVQLVVSSKEQALIDSAMKRIKRAQAKGKTDVKLNKEELAALERQRRREEMERQLRRNSGSSSERKKKKKKSPKDERVAIPLSQLEPSSRKKKSSSHSRRQSVNARGTGRSREDSPPEQVYPPMGYFPPPSTSQGRSRAGTTSRTSGRQHGDAPPVSFHYQERRPISQRHASDPHSAGLPPQEQWMQHHAQLNPFKYQTSGANYSEVGSVSSRRHTSGPSEVTYVRGGTTIIPSKSRHGSRRQSQQRAPSPSDTSDEQTSSDDLGNGAQIREPIRGRDREIVVEVSPERPPVPSKKKSSSPTKRKPVPTISGRRKKK